MPEYLVSDGGEISKYARIDSKKGAAAFVEMAQATGFATPELAMEAFGAA